MILFSSHESVPADGRGSAFIRLAGCLGSARRVQGPAKGVNAGTVSVPGLSLTHTSVPPKEKQFLFLFSSALDPGSPPSETSDIPPSEGLIVKCDSPYPLGLGFHICERATPCGLSCNTHPTPLARCCVTCCHSHKCLSQSLDSSPPTVLSVVTL